MTGGDTNSVTDLLSPPEKEWVIEFWTIFNNWAPTRSWPHFDPQNKVRSDPLMFTLEDGLAWLTNQHTDHGYRLRNIHTGEVIPIEILGDY